MHRVISMDTPQRVLQAAPSETDLSSKSPYSKSGITLVKCIKSMCFEEPGVEEIKRSTAFGHQVFLGWDSPPTSAMIIFKPFDPEVETYFVEIAEWLRTERGMCVIVSPEVQEKYPTYETYTEAMLPDLHKRLDMVICIGGDGTLLRAASLFQGPVPPFVSFHMGSLGFLTPFDATDYKSTLERVFGGQVTVTLRTRLKCKIFKSGEKEPCKRLHVLNEVVIDRGSSQYLSNLECFCDGAHVTTVQADGIIVATPTGSTAYSMSAGGSMVHPSVPGMLFTPICPHSLSFRPILLPDSSRLRIQVPAEARGAAMVSLDCYRQELDRGDSVLITASQWPLPAITRSDDTSEWFGSLASKLNWNVRERQKPMSGSHS